VTNKDKLSPEAKLLIREYALRVARKKHPHATIDVEGADYADENGQIERTVTVTSELEETRLEI
jgi:hypothetical protein